MFINSYMAAVFSIESVTYLFVIMFSLKYDIIPQAEHPIGEDVHGELYQAMRKELRHAVEEIRTELEEVGCNVARTRILVIEFFWVVNLWLIYLLKIV